MDTQNRLTAAEFTARVDRASGELLADLRRDLPEGLSPDVEIEIEILDEGMSKPTRLDDAILGPWGEKMFGVEAIADVRRDLARVQRRQTEALRRDILEALKRCSAARLRPRSRSRARRARRAAARRAAGVRSGNDPGDPDESEPPGLALWRHPKFGLVDRLQAAFLDHEAVVE